MPLQEEGMAILREWKKFTLHQGALYHCHTPARELEEVMQLVVPMAHRVAAMNWCHRDTGHQGQQQILSLLQDQFWWPGMAMQMQRAISGCERCIHHEGTCAKALLQTILVTSPLELLHVDFTGIEMMMEPDQPPHVMNVLVLCDHFTRHIIVHMWLVVWLQKLVCQVPAARVHINLQSTGQAPEWLKEPTLKGNIISKLCELMGIQKVQEHCTVPSPDHMDKWSEPTKCWCRGWLEKLGKDLEGWLAKAFTRVGACL